MRHTIVQRPRADNHATAAKRHGETVQAARRRPIQVLSIGIVVRTMTGALEAHAVIAEGDGAAQVDASLVERYPEGTIGILHEALSGQLVGKTRAAQQQGSASRQVRDVGFRVLDIENTRLSKFIVLRFGRREG